MLKIITAFSQLDFSQFADVYEESLMKTARTEFSTVPSNLGYLQARQDFYHYMKSSFFSSDETFCAVWISQGRYKAALRIERYQDGLLLEGLETMPEARGNGYATLLLTAVIHYLRQRETKILYSHVAKSNIASLKVHSNCGFERMLEYAAFIDGSVSYNSCTLCLK